MYHALSFVDLSPVDSFNETMRQIQARRAGSIALNRAKGQKAQKVQQQPTLYTIYKNVVNKPPPPKRFGYKGRIKKVADKYQGKPGEMQMKKKSKISSKSSDHNEAVLKETQPNIVVTKDENADDDVENHGGMLMARTDSNVTQMSQNNSRVDFKLPVLPTNELV